MATPPGPIGHRLALMRTAPGCTQEARPHLRHRQDQRFFGSPDGFFAPLTGSRAAAIRGNGYQRLQVSQPLQAKHHNLPPSPLSTPDSLLFSRGPSGFPIHLCSHSAEAHQPGPLSRSCRSGIAAFMAALWLPLWLTPRFLSWEPDQDSPRTPLGNLSSPQLPSSPPSLLRTSSISLPRVSTLESKHTMLIGELMPDILPYRI